VWLATEKTPCVPRPHRQDMRQALFVTMVVVVFIAHIVIGAVQAREEIKRKRRIPMMPEDVKADVEESQKCCE
jgi:hypothetical protein